MTPQEATKLEALAFLEELGPAGWGDGASDFGAAAGLDEVGADGAVFGCGAVWSVFARLIWFALCNWLAPARKRSWRVLPSNQ